MDYADSSCMARTTLDLPVGGRRPRSFSCGDAYAAQGDGEVCVTGIEAPMHGELRLHAPEGPADPGAPVPDCRPADAAD